MSYTKEEAELIVIFNDKFIVPNFYKKEHFYLMKNWSDEKLANFKDFMSDNSSADDCIVDFVNELIVDFEEKIKDKEDQDDFTCRICENCSKDFDLSDPHYYDEEQNVCYCSEKCYKIFEEKI